MESTKNICIPTASCLMLVIACTLALPCAALADEPGDAEQPTVAYTDATTTVSGVKIK